MSHPGFKPYLSSLCAWQGTVKQASECSIKAEVADSQGPCPWTPPNTAVYVAQNLQPTELPWDG